jgi:hypothetical protein
MSGKFELKCGPMSGKFELKFGPLMVNFDGQQITVESPDGAVRFPLEADEAMKASAALRLFATLVMTD